MTNIKSFHIDLAPESNPLVANPLAVKLITTELRVVSLRNDASPSPTSMADRLKTLQSEANSMLSLAHTGHAHDRIYNNLNTRYTTFASGLLITLPDHDGNHSDITGLARRDTALFFNQLALYSSYSRRPLFFGDHLDLAREHMSALPENISISDTYQALKKQLTLSAGDLYRNAPIWQNLQNSDMKHITHLYDSVALAGYAPQDNFYGLFSKLHMGQKPGIVDLQNPDDIASDYNRLEKTAYHMSSASVGPYVRLVTQLVKRELRL